MNLDQLSEIRISIGNTIDHIRAEPPEPTRTALQAHLDALLKEELRALTGQAPEGDLVGFAEQNEKFARDMGLRKDPEPPIYENLWLQATSDLNAATDLVQQHQEFFGAQCGDDKIKVIGEFFVKWAAVMMEPKADTTPWYPDDSGEWVDLPGPPIHVTTVVCARAEDGTILPPLPIGYLDLDSQHALPDLVAYKVVKP